MTLTARISNSLAAMTMIVVRNARRVTMTSTVQSGNVACKRNPLPSYIYIMNMSYMYSGVSFVFSPVVHLRCGLLYMLCYSGCKPRPTMLCYLLAIHLATLTRCGAK